jgi:hypothetical protein
MTGNWNAGNLGIKVSNQAAEVTDSGSVSDKEIIVRSTVLVDISTSMPSATRANVKAYINSLIEHVAKNEQFKIVTFGEQLTVLQDFTSDRYDLANAAAKLEFNGQQSKIYDAIFNTIPQMAPLDGEPCYYRTIVVTDGIDDTAAGVTKEELYLKLQADTYPIDVTAVSKTKQAEPEKELSALTRMSGGRYVNLYPEADAAGLSSNMAVDGIFWLRAEIPPALLDGSTRQVNITDGSNSLQFDIKVPVFDVPATSSPVPTEQQTAEATSAPAPTVEPTPITPPAKVEPESDNSIMSLFGDYTLVVFIGAAALLIILIAVIIAVAITRVKRKKRDNTRYGGDSSASSANEIHSEKTEYIGDENVAGAQFTIKLSNPNNPSRSWTLPVSGELIIGRAEHAVIRIDDKSVSREQCKIVAQGAGLAIVHLSQTNKTSLNGVAVTGSSPIQSGDTLKFGRELLRIEYIQSLGAPPPREPERTPSSGKTESIF